MKQLTQKLGNGEMVIQEIPEPEVTKNFVLVRNHYSVISPGTEGATVKAARASLIGKAKDRPQQVRQVLGTLRKQGPVQTYRAVTNKLDAYSPLGYSCSGEVLEVGEGVKPLKAGDYVACAGVGYASHAEIVSVPINLCVKLDNNCNIAHAAYNTLGAIAMQAVRQADLKIGETCLVIGLGLLGQIASSILRAGGVYVVGVDLSSEMVQIANSSGSVDKAFSRDSSELLNFLEDISLGHGVDGVLIAAASKSNDPINFAGKVARQKGRVVVLGDISTDFNRDPDWYGKELELRMSCSYGPGRYDGEYEEKGRDYPLGHVRWTQNRNMQAFQSLILQGKIPLDKLTTHNFDFLSAKDAYDLITNNKETYLGIVLEYKKDLLKPNSKKMLPEASQANILKTGTKKVGVSFVGAGSYAMSNLFPNLPRTSWISRHKIMSRSGLTAKRAVERFKFDSCASSFDELSNSSSDVIFITTRHDSHASYTSNALKKDKHVFVEKPLCMNTKELQTITTELSKSLGSVMVGFNRRYSSLISILTNKMPNSKMAIIYRVNAGAISSDHWTQDPEIGGGRVIGEVCHFIDLVTYISGSRPEAVSAVALPDANSLNDTLTITVRFLNGNTATILYLTNGSDELPKEYLEVYCDGKIAVLDDFKSLRIYGGKNKVVKKLWKQDKGQKIMLHKYLDSIKLGTGSLISFQCLSEVSLTSFAIMESVRANGAWVNVVGKSN